MSNQQNQPQTSIYEALKKPIYQEPRQIQPLHQQQTPNMMESEQSYFSRKVQQYQIANGNQVQTLTGSNQKSVQQQQIIQTQTLQQAIALKSEDAFGKVQTVLNYQDGQFYDVKQFNDPNDYEKEQNIFNKLIDSYTGRDLQRLEKVAMLPKYYNNNDKTIYFVSGVCSLQQLLDNPEFRSTPDQAVHIFSVLLEFLLLMREKGYRHSDLKPDNTQLVRSKDDQNYYVLKVIDFGSLNQNDEECAQYSAPFFNCPKRQYVQYGNDMFVKFRNLDERFKNEFYTVIRTIQKVLLGPDQQNRFYIGPSNIDQFIRFKNLQNLQAYVNGEYSHLEPSHLLHQILKFITEKGIEESYSFLELEQFNTNLISQMAPEQKFFIDIHSIIKKIQDKQITKHKLREDPLNILFGLNCFVNQLGSFSESHAEPFDLIKYLARQLFNHKQNIILIGQSGAGKTLLLIKLMKELREQNQNTNFDIVIVKLREFSGTKNNQQQNRAVNLCAKIVQQIKQQQQQQNVSSKELLLVLLDGYDELNDKNILIYKTLDRQFRKKYKKIKILVTTHLHYATGTEINRVFNTPKTVYICPFNKSQRVDYINNFLTVCNSNTQLTLQQYDIFESFQEYQEMFDNFSSLDQLCRLPFMMSLVIIMMPKLKRVLQQKNSKQQHIYTKYEIYQHFLDDYVSKRIQVLSQDYDYQLLIIEKYRQNDQRNEILKDVKLFNWKCSWHMLREQRLELLDNDILDIIEEEDQDLQQQIAELKRRYAEQKRSERRLNAINSHRPIIVENDPQIDVQENWSEQSQNDSLQNYSQIPPGYRQNLQLNEQIDNQNEEDDLPEDQDEEKRNDDEERELIDRLPDRERTSNRTNLLNQKLQIHGFLSNPETAINLLINSQVLQLPRCNNQPFCQNKLMKISQLSRYGDQYVARCTNHNCRRYVSLKGLSPFFSAVCFVLCCFLVLNMNVEDILIYAQISINTVRAIRKALWSLLRLHLNQQFLNDHRLGSNRNIVEADESRFKRHGNVGRLLQAGWFWGACERLTEQQNNQLTQQQKQNYIWGHTIIISVNDRTAATMDQLFQRYVSTQSLMVCTDGWRGYVNLQRSNYNHQIVVHEQNFVRPQNAIVGQVQYRVHTQNIENRWHVVKQMLRRRGGIRRKFIQWHIQEVLFYLQHRHSENFISTVFDLVARNQQQAVYDI